MRLKAALLLLLTTQLFGVAFSWADSRNVVGSWLAKITFGNGELRSFRIEAFESGKSSFLLLDPQSRVWGPAKPSAGKWSEDDKGWVTFSGEVEFPLGNVGRSAGMLVLKGKFAADGAIAGTARFFPADQDAKDGKAKPSKSGTFKATRTTSG
jgi:hypothetical protein